MTKKFGLADAYAVKTPEDNRNLYRDWAETYERDFTRARGYIYHEGVVALFAASAKDANIGPTKPILDVGCGTGIVGVALRNHGFTVIDGIDLSAEMLDQANQKQAYRSLDEVDVTEPLPISDHTYTGIVSAGTFTHGHLGPEPLRELARIAAPGAQFAIGINAAHFTAMGFSRTLDDLTEEGFIEALEFHQVPLYSKGDDEHADDVATVALFRRAGR